VADLAAISSLTYDGTSIQETSPIGIFIEITKGLNESPAVRGEDDVVASRSGRSSYPRLADVLAIEGEGVVLGTDDPDDGQSDFRSSMATLRALLAGGKLAPKVLAGVLEDGSSATINARVVDYQVSEQGASLAAEVKVAWESVDPDWVITPAP
jgi:hypothetical protein